LTIQNLKDKDLQQNAAQKNLKFWVSVLLLLNLLDSLLLASGMHTGEERMTLGPFLKKRKA